MTQAPQHVKNDEVISLAELWLKAKSALTFIWQNKGWLTLMSCLFCLGGYFKAYLSQPSYSASLTISLEQGGSESRLSGLASQFGFSMGAGGDALGGDNLLSLMKSRRILENVLFTKIASGADSILLINLYVSKLPKLQKQWDSMGLLPFKGLNHLNRSQDSAIGLIVKQLAEQSLAVSRVDAKLSFVTLSYSGHDPLFTKHFVELVSEKATDFYVLNKTSNSRANIDKLERRVDSVTAELNLAMMGYSQFQDQNQYTVQQIAMVPSIQKQIKVTMLTTLYGELVKNLELSKTLAAREEPLITIIDTPRYPMRIRESKMKSAIVGAFLGGFLTLTFLGIKAFMKNLNQQALELQA